MAVFITTLWGIDKKRFFFVIKGTLDKLLLTTLPRKIYVTTMFVCSTLSLQLRPYVFNNLTALANLAPLENLTTLANLTTMTTFKAIHTKQKSLHSYPNCLIC